MRAYPNMDMYDLDNNPTLRSPYSEYDLPFYSTKESLMDVETYKKFIMNAVSRVRSSRLYKHYKGFLMSLGLDHSQLLGNISAEMADIEMHHVIPIEDVALIICEHVLNTVGKISSFDLAYLIKQEHRLNHMQLVMLDETSHELYHDNLGMFISTKMTVGEFTEFLYNYKYGITQDIAFKLLMYLDKMVEEDNTTTDAGLLELRENIKEWSVYNS